MIVFIKEWINWYEVWVDSKKHFGGNTIPLKVWIFLLRKAGVTVTETGMREEE